MQCLVGNGADVNAWSQGETAIMSAAGSAQQAVYDYLYPLVNDEIRRRADKNGKKDIKRAIAYKARKADKLSEKLGNAAMYGKLERVKTLLAEGANANAITSCGKSPMMLSAMYGHIAVIETLLAAGANPNLGCDEEFEEGHTALMYAASSFFANNRAEVVATLIAGGADVNAQDEAGQTALMLSGDRADAVKALLAANPDVDLRDNEGSTELMISTWAVQRLLRQAGASEVGMHDTDLMEAAYDGDLAKVEALLQAGASASYKNGKALVNAAQEGHLETIKRLIQAGIGVNLGWETGFTPVAAAAYGGWLACVEKLLEAGADPFQRTFDGDGHDALDYAKLGEWEGNYKNREYSAVIERLSQIKNERK